MRTIRPFLTAFAFSLFAPAATAAGVGATCGGTTNVACDAGLWCDTRAGACNAPDASGACVRVPQVCTRDYRPVCGCDRRTYGNDCDRRAARVAKLHDGPCN